MRRLEEIEYMADDDLTPEELERRRKIAAEKEAIRADLIAKGEWPEERHFPEGVDPALIKFD